MAEPAATGGRSKALSADARRNRKQAWSIFKQHLADHGLSVDDLSKTQQFAVVAKWRKKHPQKRGAPSPAIAPVAAPQGAGRDGAASPAPNLTPRFAGAAFLSPPGPGRCGSASPLLRRMADSCQLCTPLAIPAPPALFLHPFQLLPIRESVKCTGVAEYELLLASESTVAAALAQPPGMTPDQALAVALYAQDAADCVSARVNSVLRKREPDEMSRWASYLVHLIAGLRALPVFKGVAFCANDRNLADRFTAGQRIAWAAFTTASAAVGPVQECIRGAKHGTLFHLTLETGRRVRCGCEAGDAGPEGWGDGDCEVLVEPNAQFEVTCSADLGDVCVVSLVQLATDSPVVTADDVSRLYQKPFVGTPAIKLDSPLVLQLAPPQQAPGSALRAADDESAPPRQPSPAAPAKATPEETAAAKAVAKERKLSAVVETLVKYTGSETVVVAACRRIMKNVEEWMKNSEENTEADAQVAVGPALMAALEAHQNSEAAVDKICATLVCVTMDSDKHITAKTCKALAEAGAIPVFLRTLAKLLESQQESTRVVTNACWVLRNLYKSEVSNPSCPTCEEAVGLAMSVIKQYPSSPETIEACCLILCSITNNPSCPEWIAQQGGVTLFIEAIANHTKHPALASAACGVLHFMSKIEANQEEIARLEGIANLVGTLDRHGKHAVVAEHACTVLANLTYKNEQNRLTVAEEGGVALFLLALRRHLEALQVVIRVCWALSNLAKTTSLRLPIASEGAVPTLLACLKRHSDSPEVCHLACRTLFLLTYNRSSVDGILEEGGISTVVEALSKHAAVQAVAEQACGLLGNLAVIKESHEIFAKTEAVSAILALLRNHIKQPSSMQIACATLANICHTNETNRVSVAREGGIALIADALREHADTQGCVEQACVLLRNVQKCEANKEAVQAETKELRGKLAKQYPSSAAVTAFLAAVGRE
eukprot:m51a1_g14719 hypothetical protein (944) ;mRNA; r:186609-190459